ncbi:MAG: FeoA family protein [Promethearchaeota archaeon]
MQKPEYCIEPDAEVVDSTDYRLINLAELPDGREAVIVRINAGRRALQRLCALGLTPGTRVKKIRSAPFRGPVQLSVRNSSLAIGRGLAYKIVVGEKN